MMQTFQTFSQNGTFHPGMYQFVPLLGVFMPLILLDVVLKGWSMWRAAKMNKNIWFIALFVVNSLGILPIIFLLLTKEEYAKHKR